MKKFFAIMFFSLMVFSQQGVLLERSYTISSEKESLVEAKKEIQDKAIANAVEDITKEIIGEDRFTKHKSAFDSKVVPKAAKFIPFSKVTEPVVKDKVTTQTVFLKVSLVDLKNVLKQNRLLEEIDLKLNVLPMIQFENSITGKKFKWWSRQDDGLKKVSLQFENTLQKNLIKSGVYLQRPTNYDYLSSAPANLIMDRWSTEDYLYLGKWFQSPFVLEGSVLVKASEKKSNQVILAIKLNLIQVQQAKVLIDLQRQFDVSALKDASKIDAWVESKIADEVDSIAQDLYQQLDEILQKGILNSQKIRLQFVMGPMPSKIENIKDKLKVYSAIVKSIREREITSQYIVYEVDFSGSVQDLQAKILATDFGFPGNLKVSLAKTNEKEMVFEVK